MQKGERQTMEQTHCTQLEQEQTNEHRWWQRHQGSSCNKINTQETREKRPQRSYLKHIQHRTCSPVTEMEWRKQRLCRVKNSSKTKNLLWSIPCLRSSEASGSTAALCCVSAVSSVDWNRSEKRVEVFLVLGSERDELITRWPWVSSKAPLN